MRDILFTGWEPLAHTVVVGVLGYAALVVLLRASGARTLAQMSSFDVVIAVAVGATFGRVLTAQQVALAQAVTAFVVLVALQVGVTTLAARRPALAGRVTASPTLLLHRGRPLPDVLRRHRVTEADLRAALRRRGLGSFAAADAVVLEADGELSVLPAGQAATATDPVVHPDQGER